MEESLPLLGGPAFCMQLWAQLRRDDRMMEENSTTTTQELNRLIKYTASAPSTTHCQERLEPISASPATNCTPTISSHCNGRGVTATLSYLRMTTRSYGKIGSTLVLQNDIIAVSDLAGLQATLRELPKNWSVVRLACTTSGGGQLETDGGRKWFRQDDVTCIRSNAILWREGSLATLQGMLPYNGTLFNTGQHDLKDIENMIWIVRYLEAPSKPTA
jgi:hypothetical protein